MNLYLASASPRRRELMERIGYDFEVRVADVDESISTAVARQVPQELSRRKAMAIAETITDGVIIGADTIVSIDEQILGKPVDENDAFRMISLLQGDRHDVVTGVTILRVESGDVTYSDTFAEATWVHVTDMSEQEIWDYIATGEPMDKAGAYGIQGRFGIYIEEIEGDYYNVVGLPICRLYHELRPLLEGEA